MGMLLFHDAGSDRWIMPQTFSLRDCVIRIPRALPWASMREAVGLQEPVARRNRSLNRSQSPDFIVHGSSSSGIHKSRVVFQQGDRETMGSKEDSSSAGFIGEITRAQPAIAAFVRSLLPTHPDYMDIVQEVNVTLWSKKKQFQLGTNFKAWAFKTAHFHVLSARRRMATEGKRLVFDPDLIELLAEAAPYKDERMEDKLGALQLCLGELREKDRNLLRVRYAQTISIEDYACQQERNPGTVRAVLRRLRGVLLKCVTNKLRKDILPPDGSPAL
jgi:RNA polymerase sigma-70 factor (ECF subfamily)